MTRFAPTLLIGLGGSGVKVLRWIRHIQERSGGLPREDLLVYRGIDFDVDANSGSFPDALQDGEFFFFDASSIADCIGNLRAELRTAPGELPRRPFREIAEWYPDIDGKSIRYAQAEAVGARQWRPLGRIGFYLNDVEIMRPLREGLVQLEALSGRAVEPRPSSICIITSIAGGTGSGILLDVAANLRKYRPEVPIRLVLLLPEFFEHVDFTSKVLANAYATLTEIAHFKNQDYLFTARYPRLPDIDQRMKNALFQRVYLLGPYVGTRRPFVEPNLAFAHAAGLLHVFLTKELRSNAGSYQINDDADENADAAALRTDASSRPVFCSFAAAAIRLLTYDELAARWTAKFVQHWQATERRDIFEDEQPSPTPEELRPLEDFIKASASPSEATRHLTTDNFARVLDEFISKYEPEGKVWTRETLRAFTRKLAELTGAGATDTPQFLAEPIQRFTEAFRAKVRDIIAAHDLTPFAVMDALLRSAEHLRHQSNSAASGGFEELEQFHLWLGSRFDSFLGQPLLALRVQRLKEWLEEWQAQKGQQPGAAWFAYGIGRAALNVIDEAVQELKAAWSGTEDFVDALAAATADPVGLNERKRERFALDPRSARSPSEILRLEMSRLDRDPSRMRELSRAMLASLRQAVAQGHTTRDFHQAAHDLLARLRDLFVRELQPGGRIIGGTQERFRYLSPESTYEDTAIRRAILSAATRIFRPGRIDNELRKRTARILVPQSFAGSDAVTDRLKHLCNGLLSAAVSEVSAQGVEENRILILVEDLFHSAEELTGIYDYYNDYAHRERKLFHIRADIPAKFGELITSLDTPGPRLCGNPGCAEDLKGTSLLEIFCPGCGKPIRNRCGNVCRMDDLTERADRDTAIEHGRCPVCYQPLRTYWWNCTRHGRMPVDAPRCTSCVAEKGHRPETRPHGEDVFVCPNCIRRGISMPFRVHGPLARALQGRSTEDAASVQRSLEAALTAGAACPKCATELAPLCRAEGDARPLRRDASGWRCDAHPVILHTCGSCDFPLVERDWFCPRCQTALVACRFCTPAHRVRVPASADLRCTRCSLPRTLGFDKLLPPEEAPSHLFCSNIYGCAAGADLYRATFPPGRPRCAICEDAELTLLEVRTRSMHVDACPFCRAVFQNRAGRIEGPARALPAGSCCLCGQAFATSRNLASAPQSFAAALAIGAALLDTRDDAVAFGLLFDQLPVSEQSRVPSHLHDYAARVQRPAVRRIVLPRLTRLLELYERQFGCQKTAATPAPPPPPRAGAPGEPPEAVEDETVDEVLSSARVARLRTNDDFERWVAAVVRLNIDYERFDAALGGSASDAKTSEKDDRVQDLRDRARELYHQMTDSMKR